MRYASKLGIFLAASAAALALPSMVIPGLRVIPQTGPGTRRSTERGNTTLHPYRGKRQRERAIRQNAMQQQLDSHKGEHVVKPRHIFGREAA